MTAPKPIVLYHFTHVDHLSTIARDGLRSDTAMHGSSHLKQEAGEPAVKARRRRSSVDAGPRGVVADYVPFYFAPRSPMLFTISKGSVSSYKGSQHDLVYLVTTEDELRRHGLELVATDRNAAAAYAEFSDDRSEWDNLVDWPLMTARMWRNTPSDPDRQQRRMAECLAHGEVPWSAILEVHAATPRCAQRASTLLRGVGARTTVAVTPQWYF